MPSWKKNLKDDLMLIKACFTKSNIIFFTCLICLLLLMLKFDLGCPIFHMTGISCPGCGMTRAYLSLLHFDFKKAFFYHPLWWLPPFVPVFWFFHKKKKISPKTYQMFFYSLISLFLMVYLFRMLFFQNHIIRFSPQTGVIYHIYSFLFSFI